MDLLTGGDDLAILDLFHNGAHLAGGHGCRKQIVGGGWGPRDPGSAPTSLSRASSLPHSRLLTSQYDIQTRVPPALALFHPIPVPM